jgi:phage baseplate assembly protein W
MPKIIAFNIYICQLTEGVPPIMTLTRIAFPFSVVDGRLALAVDVEAAGQAIEALIKTGTGEMPLSRDYGADLEYNIPQEVAFGARLRVEQKLAEYHPSLSLLSMVPIVAGDGTILDWKCEVGVMV